MTCYAFYIFAFKKAIFDALGFPIPGTVRGTPTPHGGGHTSLISLACDDAKIANAILVDSDIIAGSSPAEARNNLDVHMGGDQGNLGTLKANALNWVVYVFTID